MLSAEELFDKRYEPGSLAAMSPAEYVKELRAICSKPGRGLTNHPFITAIESGTMTLPQLQFFAEQKYLHVRNMMPFFGQMACTCPHVEARTTLIKNLAEESFGAMSKTKGHPEHFLDFCAALGMDTDAVQKKRQIGASLKLTTYYEFMSNCRPWFVPVAAIGAVMEAAVPDAFTRIAAGLKKNYGLKDNQIEFWTMHVEADKDHGDEGEELVHEYVKTPAARAQVFECGVENSEHFYNLMNMYTMVDAKQTTMQGAQRAAALA
jgi:pyrroloquinoline-quinone synthase